MAKSIINLTDNIAAWVNKANTTVNRVGDLANLNTSQDSSLVGSINALDSDIRGFLDSNREAFQNADSDILVTLANGDSDLRALIDILDSDMGNRTSLLTNDKEDLVSAINEVKAQVNNLDSSTSGITGDLNNLLLRDSIGASGTLVDAINNLDSDLTSPFFDQRVRDLFAATGDLTYDSSTGQFGVVVNNESIQDAMDSALSNGTQNGIAVSYNDVANVFNFDVNDPVLTISGDAAGSATMTNLGNTTISVSLAANTVNSSELASATRLRIYNSSGSVVKDLYGSGS